MQFVILAPSLVSLGGGARGGVIPLPPAGDALPLSEIRRAARAFGFRGDALDEATAAVAVFDDCWVAAERAALAAAVKRLNR